MLGNRDAKLDALIDSLRDAQTELAATEEIVRAATAETALANRRKGILAGIREQSWRDIDTAGAEAAITALEKRLSDLEAADGDLQQAIGAERRARAAKESAEAQTRDADYAARRANEQISDLRADIDRLTEDIDAGRILEVDPALADALDARFGKVEAASAGRPSPRRASRCPRPCRQRRTARRRRRARPVRP